MTTEEARYYQASRTARLAWEATQPQLTLCGFDHLGAAVDRPRSSAILAFGVTRPGMVKPAGLDDGPLTATDGRKHTSSVYSARTGAIIEPLGGFTSGDGTCISPSREPVAFTNTTGADGSQPGNHVRPQNGA